MKKYLKTIYKFIFGISIPIPRIVSWVLYYSFIMIRSVWYFILRVFIAEPLFKAHCTRYGRNVHTDIYIHWITGRGKLIVGDNVLLSGKISIGFASSYSSMPELLIGNHVFIGHGASITIGKRVSIGDHCYIAGGAAIMDSSGHPIDPEMRRKGMPALMEDVKPVTIEKDVWIGMRSVILPGVTIGDGSVVGACSVVTKDVPPYVVVAGNPARVITKIEIKSKM